VLDLVDSRVNTAYAGCPDRIYVVDTDGRIAYKRVEGHAGFKPAEVEAWRKKNAKGVPDGGPAVGRQQTPP